MPVTGRYVTLALGMLPKLFLAGVYLKIIKPTFVCNIAMFFW
jgi:hypothetical protein